MQVFSIPDYQDDDSEFELAPAMIKIKSSTKEKSLKVLDQDIDDESFVPDKDNDFQGLEAHGVVQAVLPFAVSKSILSSDDKIRESITIVNVMGAFDTGIEDLDLLKVAMTCNNSQYNPKRFPAVVLRFRNPKGTCLLYQNGKVVATGS